MLWVSGYACDLEAFDGATTIIGTSILTVPAFHIRWQSSDLPYLETHPMYPGSSPWTSLCTTTSSAGASLPTKGTMPPGKGTSGGGKLGTGAIVGIAVGSLLVGTLVAAAVIMMCWRRRRDRSFNAGGEAAVVAGGYNSAAQQPYSSGPVFLGGTGNVADGQPASYSPAAEKDRTQPTGHWVGTSPVQSTTGFPHGPAGYHPSTGHQQQFSPPISPAPAYDRALA